MVHELKIRPQFFGDIAKKLKTFEIRRNDRDYQVGDFLALHEYENGEYSGRVLMVKVIYFFNDEEFVKTGYCVLGIALNKTLTTAVN